MFNLNKNKDEDLNARRWFVCIYVSSNMRDIRMHKFHTIKILFLTLSFGFTN